MAVPSKTQVLADLATTTVENRLPGVIDGFFNATPLLVRLLGKEKVILDGGTEIRKPLLYTDRNAGYLGRGGTFNTDEQDTKTQMIWDWRMGYGNVTINGWDKMMNAGSSRVIDLVDEAVDESERSLRNKIDYAVWNQGDANSIDSLEKMIDNGTNYSTHAGVTRDTSAAGTAVKAQYDGTGGVTTLDLLNQMYNNCTDGTIHPDLIYVSTDVYPKIWARLQPHERKPMSDDLANAGFQGMSLNGADIVQTANMPSGRAYFLNTDFVHLWIHKDWNFHFRGWMPTANKLEDISQIILFHTLGVTNPRYLGQIRNLT